jgi:hypothetical protein
MKAFSLDAVRIPGAGRQPRKRRQKWLALSNEARLTISLCRTVAFRFRPLSMKFQSRPRAELVQLLLLGGVVLGLPFLLSSGAGPDSIKPVAFDQERYDKVARRHPHVVMIGNSMLNTRVDKPLFNELAQPNSIGYVAEGGTRSTVWYFNLKNFVVPLEPSPKVVFIFYRDYDFTAPWLHLEGDRLETARTFMKPEDEEVLAFARKLGGVAPGSALDFYLPEQITLDLRRRISGLAIDIAAVGQGKAGDDLMQKHLNGLFDFQNLRSDVFDAGAAGNDILPGESKLFIADPGENLLERFHALAESRKIQLIFYRVKRRPDENNEVIQDAELRAYTASFKAWAESKGHVLLDETEDPRLTLSMYHDGDHLGKNAMETYTRMFLERVKPWLPLPPASPERKP